MCSIIGYFGREQAAGLLVDGLRRMKYRGYDSAGVATLSGDQILVSGYLGDHGMAIMSQRENLEFEGTITSDCASLHGLVATMLRTPGAEGMDFLHCLREIPFPL